MGHRRKAWGTAIRQTKPLPPCFRHQYGLCWVAPECKPGRHPLAVKKFDALCMENRFRLVFRDEADGFYVLKHVYGDKGAGGKTSE